MSELFLAVTVIGLLLTLNAWRPLVTTGPLSVSAFFSGWLVSEAPVQHLAWQLVATAVFVRFGALDEPAGWAGLAVAIVSWLGLGALFVQATRAPGALEAALVEALGEDYRTRIRPEMAERLGTPQRWIERVFPLAMRRRDVRRTKNLSYGPYGRRNRLDVYRRVDEPSDCPVLFQVHGGAWIIGNKEQQAQPLMQHLASLGWVCVSINYRLSPRATWPDHIVDVKRALAWVKEHIAEYGGNPDYVVITGGSAGGHLSSLAALTANDPELQPGFEDADTSVQAAVPIYGVYDFTNEEQVGRADMEGFLRRAVIKRSMREAPDVWRKASSIHRIGDAPIPPFFIIHGANDTLVPVRQARLFVQRLRARSDEVVTYAELPGAQHAFEVFASVRAAHAVRAVERWVAVMYSEWLDERDARLGDRAASTG